jgi:hypothetical protein
MPILKVFLVIDTKTRSIMRIYYINTIFIILVYDIKSNTAISMATTGDIPPDRLG